MDILTYTNIRTVNISTIQQFVSAHSNVLCCVVISHFRKKVHSSIKDTKPSNIDQLT